MEHIAANNETAKDRLMKGLDSFLERDRYRALSYSLIRNKVTGVAPI